MLKEINYTTNNNNNTMINAPTYEETGIARKTDHKEYTWVAEPIFDPGYEFSCDHCGTEMEDSVSGFWKDDVRYCAHCAWDLFDQPEPISAYQIWKQEKDELKRQEAERIRLREEREEQERQHWKEEEEEHIYYLAWRAEHEAEKEAERKKNAVLWNNILAKQESAKLQERERQREQEKQEEQEEEERKQMNEENYNVLIIEPKYDFECCHCGIEMTETDGYTINYDRYCSICACELEEQEEIESTRLTCEYTGPEEHDPNYNYDALQSSKAEEDFYYGGRYGVYGGNDGGYYAEKDDSNWPNSRSYDWDPKPPSINDSDWYQAKKPVYSRSYDWDPKPEFDDDKPLFREHCDVQNNQLQNNQVQNNDTLPNSIEELYEYLEKNEFVKDNLTMITKENIIPINNMIPNQKFIESSKFSNFKSIEEIKEKIKTFMFVTTYHEGFEDWSQRLNEHGIIINRIKVFKYILEVEESRSETETETVENPIFTVSIFTDTITIRYGGSLWNQFEACLEELSIHLDGDNYDKYDKVVYDNFYTKKALCVTCGEVNYAELVYEVDYHPRMVCCDCIEKINCCDECNIVTLEHLFHKSNEIHKSNETKDLCFDCYFKKPLKEQIPLEAHLLRIIDIQSLTRNHFDILTDYAELANINIFEAYHYKSKCHFYNCKKTIEPHNWDAEQTLQFCCKRHCEYGDEIGCHCQNVYDGNIDYDDFYEEVTCKICNSPHEENVKSRVALTKSNENLKPIVSAICVFNEGIKMADVLSESLIDLCEYLNI